ncbi:MULTISPECIES: DUF1302 family protein [unclassified Pseudomonas]|uniref:DUF1302 family protein n=1 Tax=unclassified Pseudomonas TaxID=196821 RepID=UPI000537E41D|nr:MULTISPECIES: DUF1302 family protein [unclassified Pseudomonas]MBD0685807.1 hypothetical protein [Pseudomonas sp. PSB18]CDF96530.1 hypothetical protein BN844_0622 [Pseudomonas sp. SHC52]
MKRTALKAGLAMSLLSSACQGASLEALDISGRLETRQALTREGEWGLNEYSALLGGSWQDDSGWRYKVQVRALQENQLDGDYHEVEPRELFAEYQGDRCTNTLGVQQVVWGSADRLRVLDVIHAFDRREGYFGDYVQQRRPLAMLNSECSVFEDQSLQLLVIPQTRKDLLPDAGSRFAEPTVENALAGIPRTEADDPDWRKPADWTPALKWSGNLQGIDYSLNAWHGWQTEESYTARLSQAGLSYRESLKRRTLFGGSFSTPIGPVVLKGEAALVPDAYRYSRASTGVLELEKNRQQQLLLGVDYLSGDWFFGMQYYNLWKDEVKDAVDQDRSEIVSLAIRREMWQGRLYLTGYLAQDLRNSAQYAALEMRYDLDAHWQLRTGLDLFDGDRQSFGYFDEQSRWVNAVRYSF